jgi:hypothetical protein
MRRAPGEIAGAKPHETGAGGNSVAVSKGYGGLPTVTGLDELVALFERSPERENLYVRWSRGPGVDLAGSNGTASSRDSLTGVPLPGLSVNSLAVEAWWRNRPVRLWVARRLYDYRHLRELRGAGTRPWLLVGEPCGRGPDNEPLVRCRHPVAWISDATLHDAQAAVEAQGSDEWGPLDRRTIS